MRKNKFLLKIILVILCINIVACSNEDLDSAALFEKGVGFFQQGEFDKARIEFKNAIQKDPEMAEPYYYMALLNEKSRKFKAMRMNLIESIRLNPENIDAKLKLSKINLLFNETDESLQEVEKILITNPEQIEALSLKASIFLRQGKSDESLAIVDELLKKDAENIEAVSLKTLILMKNKAFDEALAILTPALQKHEKNVSLHLLKVQLDSKREDIDAVVTDYEKLVELKPENIQIKYTLAKVYLKANKKQEAESLLRSVVSENAEVMDAKILLLNLLYSIDKSRSLTELDSFIETNKDNSSTLLVFSKWLISKNEMSKAKDLLARVLAVAGNSKKDGDNARLLLAKLDFAKKEYKSALSIVENILAKNSENLEARLFKAEILTAEENYNSAIKIIENILWQDPKMDRAQSLLGTINLIQGEVDKAYTNYKEALKINPKNLRALDFIVSREVSNGHTDYAIELLEKALRFLPSQAILTKLVELNINENNWDKANKYINIIKSKKGGRILSKILEGKVLQSQNKYAEAVLIYQKVLKDYPWVKEALTGVAKCYTELNQNDKMKQYLDSFIDKNPGIYYSFILKSRMLSGDGETLKAIELLKQALANRTIKETELYIELARLYNLLGNKEEGLNTYKQGLNNNSDNIELLLNLASYFEKYSEFDKAIEQYKRILQINSRQNVAKNNLAAILLDQYGKEQDITEAIKLVKVFKQSKQPYFLDTYGWAHFKKGDLDVALSILKQVVMLAPDVPVFRYHLAETYFKLNDVMAASSELKQAFQIAKGTVFAERKIAEQLLEKIKNK